MATERWTDEMLDKLADKVDTLTDKVDKISTNVDKLSVSVDKLSIDIDKFSDRFNNYQQASQWVVNLAFSLLATATLTTIVAAFFRR